MVQRWKRGARLQRQLNGGIARLGLWRRVHDQQLVILVSERFDFQSTGTALNGILLIKQTKLVLAEGCGAAAINDTYGLVVSQHIDRLLLHVALDGVRGGDVCGGALAEAIFDLALLGQFLIVFLDGFQSFKLSFNVRPTRWVI